MVPLGLGLLGLLPAASAFSGTYVGRAGDQPRNRESRAVMVREGQATTLTLFNDVQAGQAVFGLVVPVPVEIDAGNVRVVDAAVLDGIEAYSAPRTSEVSCADLYFRIPEAEADDGAGCSVEHEDADPLWFDTGTNDLSWGDPGSGVVIEDRFTVGEYEAFVLQAQDGVALEAWLDAEGMALPPGADEVLQDYIAAGHYFLALRVELDEVPPAGTWLTPIQVGFLSEEWSLPLRLGTLSSGGVQDVVLFLLTDEDAGEVVIDNYPAPAAIPDGCLLADPDRLPGLYDELLAHALGIPGQPEELGGAQGLAWAVEFQWVDGGCEPCTSHGPLTPAEVEALGMSDGDEDYVLTRLRLRYTPQAMAADPRLVATGRAVEPTQKRYYVGSLEVAGELPTCAGTEIEDVGACYTASWMAWRESLDAAEQPYVPQEERDGCNHDRAWLLLGLPGLLGLLRRRRWS